MTRREKGSKRTKRFRSRERKTNKESINGSVAVPRRILLVQWSSRSSRLLNSAGLVLPGAVPTFLWMQLTASQRPFKLNADACNARTGRFSCTYVPKNETSTTNDGGFKRRRPNALVARRIALERGKRSQCREIAACPVHVCRRGCLALNSPSPIPVHT